MDTPSSPGAMRLGSFMPKTITHVLRHVELTGDVLMTVRHSFAEHGIAIDDAVEEIPEDVTPPPGTLRPAVSADEDDAAGVVARRRHRRAERMAERHEGGSTSDTVRMYLKEIGRVKTKLILFTASLFFAKILNIYLIYKKILSFN